MYFFYLNCFYPFADPNNKLIHDVSICIHCSSRTSLILLLKLSASIYSNFSQYGLDKILSNILNLI